MAASNGAMLAAAVLLAGCGASPEASPEAAVPRRPAVSDGFHETFKPASSAPPRGCSNREPWYRARIAEVRSCQAPFDSRPPSTTAVRLAVQNPNASTLRFVKTKARLVDEDGHETEPKSTFSGDCPRTMGFDERFEQGVTEVWLTFPVPPTKGRTLRFDLSEPHGFEVDRVVLALDDPNAGACNAARPPAPPAPLRGVVPAYTTPWYRVTVGNVRRCGDGTADPQGNVLLGVEVLVENFAKVPIRPNYLGTLKDDKGYEYKSMIGVQPGCEPKFDVTASVAPGDKLRGWIWLFVVPEGAKGLRLRYDVSANMLSERSRMEFAVGDVPR